MAKFKPRYWVLTRIALDYYRHEDRDEHLGSIPLMQVQDVISAQERRSPSLRASSTRLGQAHVQAARRDARGQAHVDQGPREGGQERADRHPRHRDRVEPRCVGAAVGAVEHRPPSPPQPSPTCPRRGAGGAVVRPRADRVGGHLERAPTVPTSARRRRRAGHPAGRGARRGRAARRGRRRHRGDARSADDFRWPPSRRGSTFSAASASFTRSCTPTSHLYRDVTALMPMDMPGCRGIASTANGCIAEAPLSAPLVPVQRALTRTGRRARPRGRADDQPARVRCRDATRAASNGGTMAPSTCSACSTSRSRRSRRCRCRR